MQGNPRGFPSLPVHTCIADAWKTLSLSLVDVSLLLICKVGTKVSGAACSAQMCQRLRLARVLQVSVVTHSVWLGASWCAETDPG